MIDVLKKPQRFEDVRLENIVETIHTPSTDISKDTRPRTVHECLMVDSGGTDPPPLEPKHDDICHRPNLRHCNRGLNIHITVQQHHKFEIYRNFPRSFWYFFSQLRHAKNACLFFCIFHPKQQRSVLFQKKIFRLIALFRLSQQEEGGKVGECSGNSIVWLKLKWLAHFLRKSRVLLAGKTPTSFFYETAESEPSD